MDNKSEFSLKSVLVVTVLLILALIVIGLYLSRYFITPASVITPVETTTTNDFKDITVSISGEQITLKNGNAVMPISNASSVRKVSYFGNELQLDIDGDSDRDVVYLITDDSGGSGTFFYLVGAINNGGEYTGTIAMFLGDRIAPQNINLHEGMIFVVNYAERAPGEPMSVQPSVGKSIWALYDKESNSFGEVVQNFEGETNLSVSASKLIRVMTPGNNQVVTNPIVVTGEARGAWYFEGSFPITVVDWDGKIIGEGYATAEEDWMTEEFVPFTGTVNYSLAADVPYKRGAIIFRKDNPSGLPELDDSLEIPVLFE